jgi:hypothetical protein
MVPRQCYSKPETRLLDVRFEHVFLQGSSLNNDGNEMFNQDPFEDTF